MIFNSAVYLIFLPTVFILYWFVFQKRLGIQNLFLLAASYLFYGWWSWKFLGLLAASTLIDYFYGFGVASSSKKKAKLFLWLSIVNNLGILAVFKYYDFFAQELETALTSVGFRINLPLLNFILPIGISFYTFHGLSYVFDIYKGIRKPVLSLTDYAVFVSFFPLLVAGPIERASHLLPQLQVKRQFNYFQAVNGCRLILWGLFKKIVIADSLAPHVDTIFGNYSELTAPTLIIGAVAFSFQIYCDFSGYSDIALGSAKLLGIELVSNFKFPYFSRDIAEFWRRWHISLSSWFKDYVYIPLGGSRKNMPVSLRNIFIIFILSGLWHGASWNFLAWGAIHASAFVPLFLLGRNRTHSDKIVAFNTTYPTWIEIWQILSTFTLVTLAWVFFRLADINDGFNYIWRIITDSIQNPASYKIIPQNSIIIIALTTPLILIDWFNRRNERTLLLPKNKPLRWACYLLASLFIFTLFTKSSNSMIYFQF